MTSGEPSGPSAARMGGYALIGAGAVAAAIGVTTALTGEQDGEQPGSVVASPPAQQPVQQEPAPPVQQPPAQPAQPPVQQPPAQQPPAQQPPAQNPAGPPPVQLAPSPGGGQQPALGGQPSSPDQAGKVSVRVYNNSTIKGLAHRAADDFRGAGYDVPEAGNYPWGKIATTTIYFRPGTPEQARAEQVAAEFGARAEPRFPGLQDASAGIIAIITDDYKGPQQGK